MLFKIEILNVQHIKKLAFEIDLSKNQLTCIVGVNGVGKTTLIRALKNFQSTDTFTKTASPNIFHSNSEITYFFNEKTYQFGYNSKLNVIDTKQILDPETQKLLCVEMPIPHGDRFSSFQRLSEIDSDLRKYITLNDFSTPTELIDFLTNVYNTNRFKNLKEVTINKTKYYFILLENGFYIREDYLSSGEFFVISLYKMIQQKCKFIIIDEIDISLDTSAQAHLISNLRQFCHQYSINILFSTHSLALMKTLSENELFHMSEEGPAVLTSCRSYNYIKSILFGFNGWDSYILTEDVMLQNYLEHLLSDQGRLNFCRYKILYIGGASNVIDLMDRNKQEGFFSSPDKVITILDGDQSQLSTNRDDVFFIPFESIEKQLFEHYQNGDLPAHFIFSKVQLNPKELYNSIIQARFMSNTDIFNFLNERKHQEVSALQNQLIEFLDITI